MIKNKIKICFVCEYSYRLFNPNWSKTNCNIFGGVDVDVYRIATELAKDDNFEVIVIVGDFNQPDEEIIDNVKIVKWSIKKGNRLFSTVNLIKILLKEKVDLFFLEKAHELNGIIRLFSKIKGKKMIYRTASDIDCNKKFVERNWLNGISYEYALEKADKVITQNESNRIDLLKNYGIKSLVIKNAAPIKNKFSIRNKKFVLWVGRGEKLKKPFLFLKLAEQFPKYSFLMICSKYHLDNINLEDLIKHSKNIKNIKILPGIEFQKVEKYFKEAKVFVNTSDYEGFPNTFVQATTNSTPILSLNVNPDNFLDKYKCGFCAKGDFELMKRQLNKLLTNRKSWKNMSKNSYIYAKNNHDIKKVIKQYKRLFFKVINETR
jgi:glycosyltransferase involved in cell wall biosynthesis